MPGLYSDKIIRIVEGCFALLARRGAHRESFMFTYVIKAFLDVLRSVHMGRPEYDIYVKKCGYPVLLYVLRGFDGNQVKTAAALGMSRNTLRKMMHEITQDKELMKLAWELKCTDYLHRKRSHKPPKKKLPDPIGRKL